MKQCKKQLDITYNEIPNLCKVSIVFFMVLTFVHDSNISTNNKYQFHIFYFYLCFHNSFLYALYVFNSL